MRPEPTARSPQEKGKIMKGAIAMLNLKRGMAAVLTEDGDYTPFEIIDSHEPELEDTIRGDFNSLGSETFMNVTQGESFDVFVEEINSSKQIAKQIVFR
jgi:hypothetical protein